MAAYKTFLDKNKYLNGKKVEYFFTHDKIDKKYYWSQGLIYANNFESEISKSEYDKAIKKYKLARYITKYSNTSSNRSKYLK